MSRHPAGKLTIKLKSIKGVESEDGSKSDVYFTVHLGHEHVKTKVHENIGRNADLSSDKPIVLNISEKEAQRGNLEFRVHDSETQDDEVLAEGELPVADAIQLAQTTVHLKPKGQLSITMDFEETLLHHDHDAHASMSTQQRVTKH